MESSALTPITTITSATLIATFSATAVVSLIFFLITRQMTEAHAEETWNWTSEHVAKALLILSVPLLLVFVFFVVSRVVEVS